MKSTGIVRRMDDLGRIVIPKEARRILGIKDGDPLEMFIDGSDLIFRKYPSNFNKKEEIAKGWTENNSLNLYQSQYRIDCSTVYCEAIICGTRRTGVAKLADGDKFSPLVGMIIAHCRATGKKIPKELLE